VDHTGGLKTFSSNIFAKRAALKMLSVQFVPERFHILSSQYSLILMIVTLSYAHKTIHVIGDLQIIRSINI